MKLVVVVVLLAAVVYAVLWSIERRRAAGASPSGRSGGRPGNRTATRPVAPDDDEDFLRDLDRKRRKDSSD